MLFYQNPFLKQNNTHMHNDGTISNLNIEFTNTKK